jgi:hypothetical protein
MSTYQLFQLPKVQAFDSARVAPGAKLSFFLTTTTTPTPVYTTSALNVTHTQPVEADASGVFPAIYLDPSIAYKATYAESDDSLIYTVDPANDDLLSPESVGAALYPRSAIEITAGVTPTNYFRAYDDPRRFGATGDGVTDDSAAVVACGKVIRLGQSIKWDTNATYLVSYTGAAGASADDDDFGRKLIYLDGVEDITIDGNGCTIKCVDHSCTNGFMFIWGTNSRRITIRGFRFDMTFTGVNTTTTRYPFVGAIIFADDATGSKTQAQLCGDILIEDCSFKLYHPYGQYATSGTAGYLGDPNNGYKLFAAFVSGDYLATAYANQNRKAILRDLHFEDGHNGYGCWAWAYNNVKFIGCDAQAWVAKYSNQAGTIQGAGVAMLRYHQFYCSGVEVTGCHFRALPCNSRSGAYQGSALFCALDTNLTGLDLDHGQSIVHGNQIILGNGDNANSLTDYGIMAPCYGDVVITNNLFDGITTATNAYAGLYILHNPEAGTGNGKSTLLVDGNTFGVHGSYNNNIGINNGSSASEGERRCKSLIVTNNTSFSQAQFFLDMDGGSSATYLGCRYTLVLGNTVIGTHNTVFSSASANSRALKLCGNQSTDIIIVRDNIVKDKYYFADCTNVHASAKCRIEDNEWTGGTTEYLGGSQVSGQVATATWDPGSIADGDEAETTVTVAGAALGDFVDVSFSLDVADLALVAAVTAANTVSVSLLNNTGGAVDLASGTVKCLVRRRT